jgi:hypothetical protein
MVRVVLRLQGFLRQRIANKYAKYIREMKSKLILIQRGLRLAFAFRETKKKIFGINSKIHDSYLVQNELFKHSWGQRPPGGKFVEIHLNSLGYDDFKKFSTLNFNSRQNFQLSRIFRLIDPNLELVYIAPEEIPIDILAYYLKILEVSGAVKPQNRLYVLYPENYEFFRKNNLSLAALTLYSPHLMKQIQTIIENKYAYIVNGFPSFNDEKLSVKLQAAIVTGVPSFNRIFTQKFAAKSLFQKLKLPTLASSPFIRTQRDLFHSVANLMVENPNTKRWMVKINDEFNGRGLAQLNTDNFTILNDLQNHAQNDRKYLKEVRSYIKKFLPTYLLPQAPTLFKSYAEYVDNLNVFGGIIEQVPAKSKFPKKRINKNF